MTIVKTSAGRFNQYLHFLGSSADRAGLDRLNQPARTTPMGNGPQEIEGRGYAAGTPPADGPSAQPPEMQPRKRQRPRSATWASWWS